MPGCLFYKPEYLLCRVTPFPPVQTLYPGGEGRRARSGEGYLKLSRVYSIILVPMVQLAYWAQRMNNFVTLGRERKQGERSAFINSFQCQKQLWAQVNWLSQADFQCSSSHSFLGWLNTDLVTAWKTTGPPPSPPPHIRGNKLPGDKSHSSSPEARPRLQLVLSLLGKNLMKCNQFLCSGSGQREEEETASSMVNWGWYQANTSRAVSPAPPGD